MIQTHKYPDNLNRSNLKSRYTVTSMTRDKVATTIDREKIVELGTIGLPSKHYYMIVIIQHSSTPYTYGGLLTHGGERDVGGGEGRGVNDGEAMSMAVR